MLLDTTVQNIQYLRNNYNIIYLNSKHLCDKWGIDIPFYSSRLKFHKKVFREIDGNRRFGVFEDRFKVKVFLPIIDGLDLI